MQRGLSRGASGKLGALAAGVAGSVHLLPGSRGALDPSALLYEFFLFTEGAVRLCHCCCCRAAGVPHGALGAHAGREARSAADERGAGGDHGLRAGRRGAGAPAGEASETGGVAHASTTRAKAVLCPARLYRVGFRVSNSFYPRPSCCCVPLSMQTALDLMEHPWLAQQAFEQGHFPWQAALYTGLLTTDVCLLLEVGCTTGCFGFCAVAALQLCCAAGGAAAACPAGALLCPALAQALWLAQNRRLLAVLLALALA